MQLFFTIKKISGLFLLTIFFSLLFFSAKSQDVNISGKQISVSSKCLTVLKFNSKITRFSIDDSVNYSGQARMYDNSLILRTSGPKPDTTNLYVTEGKRGHWFVIIFLDSIDINQNKLYYDFSNLKDVKKLVAEEAQEQANILANASKTSTPAQQVAVENDKQKTKVNAMLATSAADSVALQKAEDERIAKIKADSIKAKTVADAKHAQFVKDSSAAVQAERDRIAKMKADSVAAKRIADAQRQQFIKDSSDAVQQQKDRMAKAKADSVAAEKAAKDQLAEAADKAKKQKTIDDTKIAQAKTDSINAKNEADAKIAKIRLDSVRAKRAEDAKIAQAKSDSIQTKQIADSKRAKEISDSIQAKQIADSKRAKFMSDSIKAKQAEDLKVAKAAELARKQELAKEETAGKKRIADSIAAIPKVYTRMDIWKKYSSLKLDFDDPPPGQSVASDYFLAEDTLENNRVSNLILNKMVLDDTLPQQLISSGDSGINFTLKSIDFSWVNCYMQLVIHNKSAQDYLVGPMSVKWYVEDGSVSYKLYPCYITAFPFISSGYLTSFPVLSPGEERTIMLVTRAVNMHDSDQLILNIGDRLNNINLEMSVTGQLYNQQLSITRIVK